MRCRGFMVLALALLFTADLSAVADRAPKKKKEDPVQADLKKLQGTWQIVSMMQGGRNILPNLPGGGYVLVIKGKTYVFKRGNTVIGAGTFTLYPKRKPKAMDCQVTTGTDKGKVQKSIYEVKGDTYRECGGPAGLKRPKEFSAPVGSGFVIAVARRVK